MKAVEVTGYGGFEQLQVTDREVPSPNAGEVLVKVKACGINNTEIWMREGAYGTGEESGWRPEGVQFPRIPGSDITGQIVEVGEGVEPHKVGEDVILFPFTSSGEAGMEHLSDDLSFIGSEYDGGYAEYVVWKEELCYPMPLPDYTQSAVVVVSGLTAWHMVEQSNVGSEDVVMVTGANGGVGSYNVQIASKVRGATVIAIVGDLELSDKMKELGADYVFSYKSSTLQQDILEEVGKVDVVLDVVGDALFDTSLQVLRKGGRFCTSGSSGGQQTNMDFRAVYLNHIALLGSVLGTREDFKNLLQAVSQYKVKPTVAKTFPLSEARDAQAYFKESGKLGKVVLLPEE
ncbi:alcohol dehydrogenase [Pontibacillus halophilus JSM 076056 = DSM 19796]|uniref:Alcohol dehydrogenase n=1 Tax=Pontibacillus halophilus JSM 076056 = DSM 19796 TaxID=1385510 RepID=A0A0A5GGK7_9BACI|nr:zinc-binding dehydrogenase [Pontibacillus halophilus]KGX92376.1 alcohol dehydrogenase [Pontibacillus halophilus JSM 076056 = DSM 19796]